MTNVVYNHKKLVCIEYPGNVQNTDKMLETLNGQEYLNKVYSEPSRRLELRFRPKDIHCKCAHGDRFNTTSLLMKVKRCRKPPNDVPNDEDYEVEIMGIVDTTYKFRGTMDFQYLPMEYTPEQGYKSIIPSLIPKGLQLSSWLEEPASTFVQPIMFSRLDMPINYYYRRDPLKRDVEKKEKLKKTPSTIIGKSRKTRIGYTTFLNIEDSIPDKPVENAVKNMHLKSSDSSLPSRVMEMFEDRPIWSKSALSASLNCDHSSLKVILPAVAFYYITGPWRSLWVKFGYDPRKNPEAKIYQIIDFRVRQSLGECLGDAIPRRKWMYSLPSKTSQPQARIATIQTDELTIQDNDNSGTEEKIKKKNLGHAFEKGRLPTYRQNFYQLCDIHVAEVQRIIQCTDEEDTGYNEKTGWVKPGVLETCREIMIEDLKETVKKLKEKKEFEKSEISQEVPTADTDESDYSADCEEMDEYLEFEDAE